MRSETQPRKPHAVLDAPSRQRKAIKIERVLSRRMTLEGRHVLDVGTGAGLIAEHFLNVVGTSGKVTAVDTADQIRTEGIDFHKVTGTTLPFEDDSFDVVISNHVIEHVGDTREQLLHLEELSRVLKPGGLIYLAMPNRWAIMEPHFRMLFLSWLPRALRTPFVQLSKGRDKFYDCEPLSRGQAESLLQRCAIETDEITLEVLELMAKIEFGGMAQRLIPFFGRRLWFVCRLLIPTLVFIARRS